MHEIQREKERQEKERERETVPPYLKHEASAHLLHLGHLTPQCHPERGSAKGKKILGVLMVFISNGRLEYVAHLCKLM